MNDDPQQTPIPAVESGSGGGRIETRPSEEVHAAFSEMWVYRERVGELAAKLKECWKAAGLGDALSDLLGCSNRRPWRGHEQGTMVLEGITLFSSEELTGTCFVLVDYAPAERPPLPDPQFTYDTVPFQDLDRAFLAAQPGSIPAGVAVDLGASLAAAPERAEIAHC